VTGGGVDPPTTVTLSIPVPEKPSVRPLQPGVPDQVFPPGTNAFELLRSSRCEELLRAIRGQGDTTAWPDGDPPVPPTLVDLYTGAGEACLGDADAAGAAVARVDGSALCELGEDGDLALSATSFRAGNHEGDPEDRKAACQAHRADVLRWARQTIEALRADPAFVPQPA
jgi:hypothetical protein